MNNFCPKSRKSLEGGHVWPGAEKAFRNLQRHLLYPGGLPCVLPGALNMYMIIVSSSNDRCFVTRKLGDVRCGPNLIEARDEFAVFLGAKYPHVLLRAEPSDGTYRFVGTAIIPGIMLGEIFDRGIEVAPIQLR